MFPLRDTIPVKSPAIVNWLIILLCTCAFLLESLVPQTELQAYISYFGLVPAALVKTPDCQHVATIFSSMFMHAGWAHLLGNMWFLFIFGDNVEDRLGHATYFLFYLFTGICAAATQVFVEANSHAAMVGASGAISGVLGAYFVFFPEARVISLVPLGFYSRTIELPAFVFLGLWFLLQLVPGVNSLTIATSDVGGVAFWAHVGGFISGWVLAQFWPKENSEY